MKVLNFSLVYLFLLLTFLLFSLFSDSFHRHLSFQVLAFLPIQRPVVEQIPQKFGPNIIVGTSADMSQLLQSSPKYIKNSKGEDLIDIAAKLGINMIRITNTSSPNSNSNAIYTKKEWDMVLNKMYRKRIKALLLIESPSIFQKYIQPEYTVFVQNYILDTNILRHPAVYGVDLYNEPVVNSEKNILILKTAAAMIKKKYPQTLLTVGWWGIDMFQKDEQGKEVYNWDNFQAGTAFDSFIDFYSIHMYGFDKPILGIYPNPYNLTNNFLNKVKADLQTKKPILIEEFGAANGDILSDQGTIGSPEIQKKTYEGVYQTLIDMKDPQIIGSIAYQFISRGKGPDAWAIIKDNGDYIFPAAKIIKNYQ